MTDAPAQDHKIIRKIIPGFMQPLLRGLRKRIFSLDRPKEEPYRTVFPYTQAHLARQKSLLHFASDIDARNVPGVIVECGVLDGGTAALMAFGSSKSERKIHLFDSWRGLPETTGKDGEGSKVWSGDLIGCPARVQSVTPPAPSFYSSQTNLSDRGNSFWRKFICTRRGFICYSD
jgi:hypothetical protein